MHDYSKVIDLIFNYIDVDVNIYDLIVLHVVSWFYILTCIYFLYNNIQHNLSILLIQRIPIQGKSSFPR